jgi:hypothetical protein
LNDGERSTLADIGKKLGKKALEEVAHIASCPKIQLKRPLKNTV